MQLIVSSLVVLLATIPMETISIKLNNEKKAINRIATHHPMDQIKQQPDEEQQKEQQQQLQQQQQQPMQKYNQQQQGEKKFEDYQHLKELRGSCQTAEDCRIDAHVCRDGRCQCASFYRPDSSNTTCIAAIGKRCMYDSHCITKAYCKGQTICTCKTEYPIVSDDKWACEDDSSVGSRIYLEMENVICIVVAVVASIYCCGAL